MWVGDLCVVPTHLLLVTAVVAVVEVQVFYRHEGRTNSDLTFTDPSLGLLESLQVVS